MKHAYSSSLQWLRLALVLSLLAFPALVRARSLTPQKLAATTTDFLQKFVDEAGAVNYAALQRNPRPLNALLRDIADFEAAKASADEQFAFYLNSYNVLVIGSVVAHYPLTSVLDMPGFFNKNRLTVAGEQLTLDELEHGKLRRLHNDPRLNFALVCGTASCPRLSRLAYTSQDISAQLDAQTCLMLQDPAFVRIDAAGRSVELPEIFQWYKTDFGTSIQADMAYINAFRASNAVPPTFAVSFYPYDWTLNDQKK